MVMLNESSSNPPYAPHPRRNRSKDEGESSAAQHDQGITPFLFRTRSGSTFENLLSFPRGLITGAGPLPIEREEGRQFEIQAPASDEHDQSVDSSGGDPDLPAFRDQHELFARSMPPSRPSAKLEPDAIRILRKHFVEKIVTDMRRIEQQTGKPNAVDYAASLFRTMRQVRDQTPADPFVTVVMALHDALAYKNRWSDYAASQYEQARAILVKFANQELFPEKVEKAVMELEAAGFDTTPFEVEFAPDEE